MRYIALEPLTSAGSGVEILSFGTGSYVTGQIGSFNVMIECSSLTTSNLAINGCSCYTYGTGSYIVSGPILAPNLGSSRALVMKTLFYGTNGKDPRAGSNYITGITGIKVFTNSYNDVGRRAYYVATEFYHTDNITGYTGSAAFFGSFEANCGSIDSWSRCWVKTLDGAGGAPSTTSNWEIPSGSTRNTISAARGVTAESDEIGWARNADREINQSTFCLRNPFTHAVTNTYNYGSISVLMITTGSIHNTFNMHAPTSGTWTLGSIFTDFQTIHNVPVFELSDINVNNCGFTKWHDYTNYITSANTFVAHPFGSISSTTTLNYDVSFDAGNTWIDVTGNPQKISGSPLPTTVIGSVIHKVTLERSDPTTTDKIDGFGISILGSYA